MARISGGGEVLQAQSGRLIHRMGSVFEHALAAPGHLLVLSGCCCGAEGRMLAASRKFGGSGSRPKDICKEPGK